MRQYHDEHRLPTGSATPKGGVAPPVATSLRPVGAKTPGAMASALFTVAMPNAANPVEARTWEGEDYIDLPVQYSGVAEGTAVFADDFKFSITAADGSQWSSPWQHIQERNLPGIHYAGLSLMIDPALYERFKTAPVTLRITLAVSRYQSDTVTKMAFPSGDATIPGIGF